ncbi:hypothetical protein [Dactylosporangium sp. NPDC000521]|uniref:hypothetical protein n=1 Tax=Dactylosporangium sp. NPDC000521 TaxID=3363975 RepID=UPI003676F3DE
MTVEVERPARPAQVTVAFWLQLAGVAVLLTLVGMVVAYAVHFDGEISRAAAAVPGVDPREVSDERTGNVVSTLFVGVPALVLALWLGITALPVLRGSNIARIFVFVAAGGQLMLLLLQMCGGFLLLPLLATADWADEPVTVDDGATWDSSEPSRFQDVLYSGDDDFSDLTFLGGALGVFAVLMLSVAIVLMLALPPAHRYFVPRAAAPVPPAWPAYPGPYFICPDPAAHVAPAWPAANVTPAGVPAHVVQAPQTPQEQPAHVVQAPQTPQEQPAAPEPPAPVVQTPQTPQE